ncbi:MAG TPA: antitoxin [Thermoanaerobaculia bacterium]|jgi:hypothetical protein
MRTTLDIADPILEEVKRLKAKEEKTLGEVVSELLAEGLAVRRARKKTMRPKFEWPVQDLQPKIDLDDKDALWALFDADAGFPHR